MACFTVPAVEAVVVTAAYLAVKKREVKLSLKTESEGPTPSLRNDNKIKFSKKLYLLMTMLWGGVFLLVIDHIWSGELVPYPPFFAAMSNPEDMAEMLYEIKTLGVLMSVSITAFWGIMCVGSDIIRKIKPSTAKSNIN